MMLNNKRGVCQNVDDAVILPVGARFARPETACFVYYSQSCNRRFGQANPAPTVDYLIDHFTFGPLIFCLVLVLHSQIYSLLHDIRPVQQFLCPSVLTGNPLCIFLSMGLLIHCVQHVLVFMQQMNGIRLFVFPEQQ